MPSGKLINLHDICDSTDPPKTAVKGEVLLLPHVTDEETEAQRGEVISPRSPS